MEILSPPNPHIFSVVSLLSNSNRYSIKIYTNKNPRNFRVSAHFDRAIGRRKSHLRKKLIEQQVRQNPTSLETPIDDIRSNLDDILVSNPHTASTTVFQDSNDKVEVNQDEILRISRIEPSPSLNQVDDNANLLAKEIPNSSLVNLVDSSWRFITEKPKLSRVGVSVFCCFLLFIAFKSFFRKPKENEEYTGLEKEMLRRKVKARMSKQNSILEVIQDSEPEHEPEMIRPQLDKDELMNNLDKIQEIRAMATRARQIESSTDNEPAGKDLDASLPQADVSVQDSSDVLRVISSVKEAREYLHKKEPKRDSNDDSKDEGVKGSERADREKWIEDNFHEFEPLVEKIRGGFRNNYMVAREKVKQDMDILDLVSELERDENGSGFEWMKDEKLSEIVFQVRENELMGRDPFYLMDAQDKALFFKGLEEIVEKENEKLGHLHEYLHSNIENLDYGADGISLYDSPEKIIPRWKGPPPTTTTSQFLDNHLDQRKTLFSETLKNLDLDSQNKSSKTVIEGSDGSVKPGKKSGKEFWQHTKKWSRGFIDSYNAENDPETKAAMKDIGKDLDRWITEKEIQDAADIMNKVPDKGKTFITERIDKLKREMELFGPQAVVSKYSEYGDEEEIDYYWWLDLPYVLCIEIYIDERIGFYSLEMASDLELDPKPHHIIAFEDAGDCKNLCYVIQTHMETVGNGNAFVVPQMPKDTYKEAKENGFNVTVIRKGELKLDVDQTLEDVEEKIVEIGSKMYQDQIMKSRNVNVDSVMKGVFGLKKNTNRRRLKRPTK